MASSVELSDMGGGEGSKGPENHMRSRYSLSNRTNCFRVPASQQPPLAFRMNKWNLGRGALIAGAVAGVMLITITAVVS